MPTPTDYLLAGINPIRPKLDGTKSSPGLWKEYQQRMVTTEELNQFNGCGFGAICGAISSNLHVIDIDYDCEANLKRLFADLPDILPRLVIVATPRPGWQLWFRQRSAPPSGHVLAYTEPIGDPPQPKGMIETRGSGNYVCAPGTPTGTHKHDKPYQFVRGDLKSIPLLDDADVEQLQHVCRSYTRYTPQHVEREHGEKYEGAPRPGDIFNQQANFLQLMLDAKWSECHREDNVVYLARPGKDTPGSSATLGYLQTDDGRPLLHVFSTNAAPFQSDSTYDAFGAFTTMHFGGDHKAAAAQIRIQYATQLHQAEREYERKQQIQTDLSVTEFADINTAT